MIRIFIILHDCGHGSFFRSARANEILGSICGVFTLTPFYQWRHDHAMHHATSSDLDRRGYGDVPTLTVAEYLRMSSWARFKYRTFRHPLLMLLTGPVYSFVVRQRVVLASSSPRERRSVHLTNLALLAIIGVSWPTIGLKAFLLIQGPVVFCAGFVAVWLFYCQHQFEGTYWRSHQEWNFEEAAIKGSSYFHLPRLLQWVTGNIGFHHVHHLCPRIPNYYLERVHWSHPRFQEATTLTIRSSLQAFTLKLWNHIATIVMIEGTCIGLLSWVPATLLALPLSRILSDVLGWSIVSWPLVYVFPPFAPLLWIGIVVLLSASASYLPARHAARINVRNALEHE